MYLVRYGEIGLKSSYVKKQFQKQLKENIIAGLKRKGLKARVSVKFDRLFVESRSEKVKSVLEKTFGITSFSKVSVCRKSYKSIEKRVLKEAEGLKGSFAIRVNRADKSFGHTSQELEKKLGDAVRKREELEVNLDDPDHIFYLEIRNKAYAFTEKIPGPGGLPVGVSGKVVCLLSGGIDSPVAVWMMLKRGCQVVLLHANTGSYSPGSLKGVKSLVRHLQEWSALPLKLLVFDHEKVLKKLEEAERLTCVLCKRHMYRMAEEVARREKAGAIVTGDNLSQVATQTLQNLSVIEEAVELPVFRPLISADKQEAVDLAKRIGTYPISARDKSCSAVPDKPRTKSSLKKVKGLEKALGLKGASDVSLKSVHING